MGSVTCPDCGDVKSSKFRSPSLGAHRGSKKCAARALRRRMEAAGQGQLPRVWRWVLKPLGIACEEGEGVNKTGARVKVVFVPAWAAEVAASASNGLFGGWSPEAFDLAAERAVGFLAACKVEPQLIEAFRAAKKLGGDKVAAAFMADHEGFIAAFRGGR